MVRPTLATVSLDAIKANVGAIQRLLAEEAREGEPPGIIAVLKANAYGHGATQVGLAMEAAGASMVACADIEEGITLREAGVSIPILVFGALSISDLSGVFGHRLTPTVSSPGAARALSHAAAERGVRLGCHLKIDTGMNRLGFRSDNLRRSMTDVLHDPHLVFDAVYTHFATADVLESPFIDEQRTRFDSALDLLGSLGLPRVRAHAANSAALLRDRRTWYDWVRPGLLLYGIMPPPFDSDSGGFAPAFPQTASLSGTPAAPPRSSALTSPRSFAGRLALRPALSLTSRIVAVKGLRPGEGTGYGLKWTTNEPRSIAIVPAGYADGLDTRLANRASVLIRGRQRPIVGSVCMDMIMIDVTGSDVSPGDEVTLIGRQGPVEITAREMAAQIGTIPWEVVCRLGARIERQYV